MKSVVDVKNIQKMYGKKGGNQSHVLINVSFFIQEGEFLSSIESSDFGKTIPLHVISVLDKTIGGVMETVGTDIMKVK